MIKMSQIKNLVNYTMKRILSDSIGLKINIKIRGAILRTGEIIAVYDHLLLIKIIDEFNKPGGLWYVNYSEIQYFEFVNKK